jgi:protein-L-isoaspartate(D-aspartate) O-methyltransferase
MSSLGATEGQACVAHDLTRQGERLRMVHEQLERRQIRSPAVLEAMAAVPRERFVPRELADRAYEDCALPIEQGQTISQPYIVALMTELAQVRPGMRVLEVGTGSGYQAAVLAALGADVYSVELEADLAERAKAALSALGLSVHARVGDGYAGWPEAAPYDAILVTAAPRSVPFALSSQLALGGRMVVPVGERERDQHLFVVRRTAWGEERESVAAVRFVPMRSSPS